MTTDVSLENMGDDELKDIVRLQRQLLGDTKTRKKFLSLAREVRPDTVIPELDTEAAITAALTEERTARETLENKVNTDNITRSIEKKREGIKTKFKLTDEDVTAVETLMTERKIGDHETAAEYFTLSRKAAVPTSPHLKDATFQKPEANWFKGNAVDIARGLASEALNDIQKHRATG